MNFKKPKPGTDLKRLHPGIASMWDQEANGGIPADEVPAYSHQKAHWKLDYTDTNGKVWPFKWEAPISDMTRKGRGGCPFLTGKQIWPGFNDLASQYPEVVKEWDFEKNDCLPSEIFAHSARSVYWVKELVGVDGQMIRVSWKAAISNRANGAQDPFSTSQRLLKGYNDLESLFPQLAKEWDYDQNEKGPDEYLAHSNQSVHWKITVKNKSGEDINLTWKAPIAARAKGDGNPYDAGKKVMPGYNDLASQCPELLADWDYERNAKPPSAYAVHSTAVVWWRRPRKNKLTKQIEFYHWRTQINHRANGSGPAIEQNNRLEGAMRDLLAEMNISFKEQLRIKECKTSSACNGYALFDFALNICDPIGPISVAEAISKKIMLVELDGIGHFTPISNWNIDNYKRRDSIKTSFCEKNGIPLLRIRFDQIDIMREIIEEFIASPQSFIHRHNPFMDDSEYCLLDAS